MDDERRSWNQRYGEGSHPSLTPDPFLVRAYEDFVLPLHPAGGRALDLAGGTGRHSIWLARRNWRVTLLDISEVGIARAKQNAGPDAARIDFRTADLRNFSAAGKNVEQPFDLVMVFYYLERSLFPALVSSLGPGGLVIYKTYTVEQTKFGHGPSRPVHLLRENELLHAFAGLHILHYLETVRDRGVAELVGRKR